MERRTKWLLAAGLIGVPVLGGLTLLFLARQHAAKIEPYIRDQAIAYLRDRFGADVNIDSLKIDIPALSPVKLYVTKGAGVLAAVTGHGVHIKKNENMMFRVQTMRFEVDLGQLFEPHKGVTVVRMDDVDIVIPPKGERPKLSKKSGEGGDGPDVKIGEILITNGRLVIKPKDPSRKPLEFELYSVRLFDAGPKSAMRYEAEVRNAKPPGDVKATGHFGPWNRDEPGDSHLDGDYIFERANLNVFKSIGGILNSKGHFDGQLNDFIATGEATVPEFFLKSSGNKVPLYTKFEVQVDGTNGNTILKPVHGRLGQTSFVTSGGVVKHEGDRRRTIELDVNMPAGRLEDVLTLAMKGPGPFMSGILQMKSRILVPPLSGKVVEKLQLNGEFVIKDGKFHRSTLQDRIDQMSRQAQGQPKNQEIDEVVSVMSGRFEMANETITLHNLLFGIPGADLNLDGTYNVDTEVMDFHGDLRLKAKLSQTQSGWKRWALKPVDPFFAKNGAGLYTRIKITGTRKDPKFSREK